MLSSSKEYIQALRDGNYLLFLEWPQFIKERYKEGPVLLNSDDLPSLLCFEWLNNEYCEDDAKKLALLATVNDLPSRPLQGHLSFTVITMMAVVFRCMLFHQKNIQANYLTKKSMKKEEILKLMDAPIVGIDKANFNSLLVQQDAIFQDWIKNSDKAKVSQVCKQIKSITDLRNLMQDYKDKLKKLEDVNDKLKASRMSVVDSVLTYLSKQYFLTPSVKEAVIKYVNQLKTLQPAEFEEEYLNRLVPLSVLESAWKLGANIAVTLFAYVQPAAAPKPAPQPSPASGQPSASVIALLPAPIVGNSKVVGDLNVMAK